MAEVFRDRYAAAYDTFYADKDYATECEAVIRLIAKFGEARPNAILDLGCGTGRHAVIMAQRGFNVTGVDRSEAMVALACERAKHEGLGGNPQFLCRDIRSFSSDRRFDTALMNFNVLGYMTSNDDGLSALGAARGNLRQGGLIVADFWYGPAILADPPGHNTRSFGAEGNGFIRSSSGRHLPDEQCCEIQLKISQLDRGRVIDESTEFHRVRYFFPLELDLLLRASGFRLLALTGFPDVESPASPQKWIAAMVAKAI